MLVAFGAILELCWASLAALVDLMNHVPRALLVTIRTGQRPNTSLLNRFPNVFGRNCVANVLSMCFDMFGFPQWEAIDGYLSRKMVFSSCPHRNFKEKEGPYKKNAFDHPPASSQR